MAVEDTYSEDDWFDLDKYRQAAGVAYEFSKKKMEDAGEQERSTIGKGCLLYTSPSPRDRQKSRMPSSA